MHFTSFIHFLPDFILLCGIYHIPYLRQVTCISLQHKDNRVFGPHPSYSRALRMCSILQNTSQARFSNLQKPSPLAATNHQFFQIIFLALRIENPLYHDKLTWSRFAEKCFLRFFFVLRTDINH